MSPTDLMAMAAAAAIASRLAGVTPGRAGSPTAGRAAAADCAPGSSREATVLAVPRAVGRMPEDSSALTASTR
ncbi:Uncharacterised protein [Mycobacterium tuberculosis]|nr:Uncharacterised protein [Mycobacterium tuberculosis]